MSEVFWNTFVIVVLMLDPLGNITAFNSVLCHLRPERRMRVIARECVIAYGVLLVFALAGQPILKFFHLSQSSLGIAGGLVLFLIALKMIFGTADNVFGDNPGEEPMEPLIVPLAIPLLAGPSAIANVMLQAARHPGQLPVIIAAITLAFGVTAFGLVGGARLASLLGAKGLSAMTRLIGLVLIAVSVEMMLGGIRSFVLTLSTTGAAN